MSKTFAYDPAGNPVEIQEHQLESAATNPHFQGISQQEAQQAQQANVSADRVAGYGKVAQALGGFANGLTLGGAGAAATGLGMIDQGDMEALGETGAFKAGDIAGMLAPAFFTGGESVAARGAMEAAEVGGKSLLGRALGWTPAGLMGRAGGVAEALAGRVMPEAGGLLGKVLKPSLQMASRGATEGAIVNMAHTASDGVIQNKPLTAQALAASGVDGALYGGLAGGILGGAGALAGAGVDAVGSGVVGRAGGKGDTAAAVALKRLGASGDDLARMAEEEGGLQGALRGHYDILAKGGESLKSSTKAIAASVKASEANFAKTSASVIETADREAASAVPDLARMEARIQTDLETKWGGTAKQNSIQKAFGKLQGDLDALPGTQPKPSFDHPSPTPAAPYGEAPPVAPTGPGQAPRIRTLGDEYEKASNRFKYVEQPEYKRAVEAHKVAEAAHDAAEATRFGNEMKAFKEAKKLHDEIPDMLRKEGNGTWAGWEKSRQHLSELVEKSRGGPAAEVYQTALNAMDSEMASSLTSAMEGIGKGELATQYASAKSGALLAKQTGAMVKNRLSTELGGAEAPIGARDVGTFVGMSAIGHPLSGAAFVSAKGIGKILQRKVEPAIAEAAYRMAMGAEAASATVTVGNRINNSLRNFITGSTRAVGGYKALTSGTKYDPGSFSKTVELADRLTDANHQAKVQEMAQALTQAGHPELATEMLETNKRATDYINHNRVKDPKMKQAGSLMKLPKDVGMSTQAQRFMRITRAIREPLSVLDDMNKGSLSRDAVYAFKYVYPDLHTEVVSQMASQLMEHRQAGKFVGPDKLNTLATMACGPLDPKQEKSFVQAVQSGIASAKQPPGNQPGQGSSGGGQPVQTAYSTPLQSAIG